MNLSLRLETPKDYYTVEQLAQDAFWGYLAPTCEEHYLVHILRSIPAFVQELDYVAEADGKLVGNVLYSKAKVIDQEGKEHEVLTFGPLSVLPSYWNQGVGSTLLRYTIKKAKESGYPAIIIYGHPDYYPRLGFRNAKAYNIMTPDGSNFDALMALPLYEGALVGISGKFYEDSAFHMDPKEVEEFNLNFPIREPAYMPSIDLLLNRLEPSKRKVFTEHNITTLALLNTVSGRELLAWDGIDESTLEVINHILKEYGYAEKLLPSSEILKRAELGAKMYE